MLEEFMNVMTDENVKKLDDEELNAEVKNIIDALEVFSNNSKMLTNSYTDILVNDNVVYLMTRISQNTILSEHFPELYFQNENGETIINCQQNSPYHRYGVFRHILCTVEYVGKDNLKYSKHDLKLLKWTMFLHDIGKPFVKTTNAEGRDSFAGHDDVSVEMAERILNRFDFNEDEKKIILTLIKYHDRYLNDGEITHDNLEFLANELGNKKELFDLLIEVKTADNKAKSIDVYNKFLTVLPKYKEFAANYFKEITPENDETISLELSTEDPAFVGEEIIGGKTDITENKAFKKNKRITDEDFNQIYDNIINDQDINYYYIPIVDIDNKKIFAYEVQVGFNEQKDIHQVLLKAREEEKFDKIQQLLFVNQANNGLKEKKDARVALLIKIDMASFEKYNNKNRIYDMLDKDNIIISFENYDDINVADINGLCNEIAQKHGVVSLSEFNKSKFTLKELSGMNVDFVEFSLDENLDEEKLEVVADSCVRDAKKVIIKNVNKKKDLERLNELGISLIQGVCLFDASERIEITDYEVEKVLD